MRLTAKGNGPTAGWRVLSSGEFKSIYIQECDHVVNLRLRFTTNKGIVDLEITLNELSQVATGIIQLLSTACSNPSLPFFYEILKEKTSSSLKKKQKKSTRISKIKHVKPK